MTISYFPYLFAIVCLRFPAERLLKRRRIILTFRFFFFFRSPSPTPHHVHIGRTSKRARAPKRKKKPLKRRYKCFTVSVRRIYAFTYVFLRLCTLCTTGLCSIPSEDSGVLNSTRVTATATSSPSLIVSGGIHPRFVYIRKKKKKSKIKR